MRTYDASDVAAIDASGKTYRKIGLIRAVQSPEAFAITAREGTLSVCPAGTWVATDGLSVWPIAPDFMEQHYVEVSQ